jgi:hypothetical protein
MGTKMIVLKETHGFRWGGRSLMMKKKKQIKQNRHDLI